MKFNFRLTNCFIDVTFICPWRGLQKVLLHNIFDKGVLPVLIVLSITIFNDAILENEKRQRLFLKQIEKYEITTVASRNAGNSCHGILTKPEDSSLSCIPCFVCFSNNSFQLIRDAIQEIIS